ncbi:MAG: RNA methyltransferase [Bacteroidetes bacterium]|jgi:tRNA G18 (ribose-2'-O)-methylase SpoU|nr:RNA methyltransferase [Bacteroidota bacterium]
MRLRSLDNLDAPELRAYRTLRRPEEHLREGLFIAEGDKVALRLFESGLEVVSILLTPAWLEQHRHTIEALVPAPEVFVAPKEVVEKIVGFPLHQGIMALGRVPRSRATEETLAEARKPWLLVALDGLANAENVGVLVRNAAAFGATAIVAGETSSSPYLRRAVRNSMGTVFRIPVLHPASLSAWIDDLRDDHGVRIIAADADPQATPLPSCDLRGNVCVVFGSEGMGLRPDVLARCHERTFIPMQEGVDSLNVASASAAVLYEARRQRISRGA